MIAFFPSPAEVRRIIYTTNAIEALNSRPRRAVRACGQGRIVAEALASSSALFDADVIVLLDDGR